MKVMALAAIGADLLDKALQRTQPDLFHPRSAGYLVLAVAVSLLLAAFVSHVPSPTLGVAAGLAIGGALANAASALAWSRGVPDPLVAGGFAFNLADLFVLAGVGALVVVSARLAVGRNRQ